MIKRVWILVSPIAISKRSAHWFLKLCGLSLLLIACAGPAPPSEKVDWEAVNAATLPPLSLKTPTLPVAEASPTNTSRPTLDDILASYGMERWIPEGGDQSRHPITSDILSNPATYGAFLDELDMILGTARRNTETIAAQGGQSLIEIYWNGVSSYSEGTEVDIVYREAENPETRIWVNSGKGGFSLISAEDIEPFLDSYPDDVPIEWQNPGYLVFMDDPWDHFARGLHLLDGGGRAIALWDDERNSFEPWKGVGPFRYKIVNGRDVDFYGFSEEQLDILWEAFAWINIDKENVNELFETVVSVRTTDLPEWIAGVAGVGDIRVDPAVFTQLRDFLGAPRQADVLQMAALLVHEAVHINQPGECSPEYAATQGMSFSEYGLFIETGPEQAYEQQVRFLERILSLANGSGSRMVNDPDVRLAIQMVIDYYGAALGGAFFSDGSPVPTCADP